MRDDRLLHRPVLGVTVIFAGLRVGSSIIPDLNLSGCGWRSGSNRHAQENYVRSDIRDRGVILGSQNRGTDSRALVSICSIKLSDNRALNLSGDI